MEARRQWDDIFKALKTKTIFNQILSPGKMFFKTEGQIKTF